MTDRQQPRALGSFINSDQRDQRPDLVPEPPRRAPGRPRKAPDDQQSTTIRMSADDHRELRMLAFRERIPMNDLVLRALRQYCDERDVQFTGGRS